MVKAKRGKKPAKDGSDDSDVDNVDELTENVDQLSLKPGNAKTKQKKKPAQRAGFELLLAGESGEESADSNDDEDSASKPDSKSKPGKKPQEDDEDSEEAAKKSSKSKTGKKGKKQAVIEDDSDNSDLETKAKSAEEAKGGKKSKRKKKKDESDEDIEKILAELQMEYSGVKSGSAEPEESKGKKKAESKDKEKTPVEEENKSAVVPAERDEAATEGSSSVKSTAQKKREKREREKLKKQQQKIGGADDKDKPEEEKPSAATATAEETDKTVEAEEDKEEGGKKKKGKKGAAAAEVKEDKKAPKKNKMIAAIQEAQKKLQEEEERLRMEAEEQDKKLEALEDARLEQERLEQERKERKKKKEKERKERLKAEGKLLTPKQKADRARAQAMLEALGVAPLAGGEKKMRPGTRIRPSKVKQQSQQQTEEAGSSQSRENSEPPVTETSPQPAQVEEVQITEEVKDSWDAESSGSDAEATSEAVSGSAEVSSEAAPAVTQEPKVAPTADESGSEESDDDDSGSSDGSEDLDEDLQHLSEHERKRAKAMARIEKRKDEAEKKRSPENLRAAVICVLGHVDTGKTKILDKLRRTSVQAGEAGGITQQIGATNVPMDAIKEQTKIVRGFADVQLKMPGLLIIDTPGHASFSNLRSRGSSLCDMAILVVDIMHGLEEQTLESINLLKAKKTPFIVALNKIDRLYDWSIMARKDIRDIIKSQASNTQAEFDRKTKEVILQFAEQGLNAALFYENPDVRSYVSLVPTSAITGEGMGNLLALIVENCQTMLTRRLMYSEELQATVLEVKAITGLGTTIDCILVNGCLREGETIVLASSDGNAIVTQIRSLLMPQPMKELRVKNEYIEYKEIIAAQGVKIAAKDLEKAIAGLNMLVAHHPDEVDICKEEVVRDLARELGRIKLQQSGVLVQASTLGSLEALLEFLKDSKIPYSSVKIGPVVKKDVMRAASMLERDSQYGTILAFDVKIERDAQEMADSLGVKIFTADIIYHLFDQFTKHREDLRQSKRQQFKNIAVFPCKLRILPQYVFNSRDPIVAGVIVEDGIVCVGTPICVPNKEPGESAHFVDIGVVTSIEINHKVVETARRGQEVCVKIEPTGDGAPKMFGRHFDEKDFLLSKISRQSIDACKEYFREDLLKSDWQLMVELKKIFQIL